MEKNIEKKWNIEDKKVSCMLTKQNARFVFFLFSSLLTYSFFMWNLFRKESFLVSWILFCILFIELIFLSIDMRGIRKRIMRGVLFIIGIIFCLFVPNPVRQVITSVWLSLVTIWFLLVYLRGYFDNVRKINWLSYFTRWGYIFTLMTTITFGFAVLWINTKFPFQCSQISNINETLLKTTTTWIFFWNDDVEEEKPMIEIKTNTQEHEWWEEDNETIITEARNIFKTNIVDWFIESKDLINNKVCEAVVSQIDEIYQNPVFQIGVIFWIYLLFYWVIRLLVWIITIIWYMLFLLVKFMWLYSIEKETAEVENVL